MNFFDGVDLHVGNRGIFAAFIHHDAALFIEHLSCLVLYPVRGLHVKNWN